MSHELIPVETLERLSRQEGVDVRPILVRVLTDLFVQKPDHSPEEVARYVELVSQLLDVVNVDARAAVARKLAGEPRAPHSLVERLIADDIAVSAPILARFPDVSRQTLLALALDGGPAEAAAIASREDLDSDLIRLLARHPDEFVLETLVANAAVRLTGSTLAAVVERAARSPALAAALLRRDDLDAVAFCPLYLFADPARRASIRAALASRPGRIGSLRSFGGADELTAAIDQAVAHEGGGRRVAESIAEALELRPDDAARLVTEPSGEPFVLMLRAAGLDSDVVARALLVAQPEIATSVARVFALVEIAETTSRSVAAEVISALIAPSAKSARHEPLFEPIGVMERAGAARAAKPTRRSRLGELARQRG
ncbi:DUF2336 domain-containing protein [Hansschlegelia zhihuaiae]|uniref:DUF2336 domain-containing protein n=1 Tax=Hansschlegelia zhihuaiae TaxID=405005 RepID=A0A4Q0MIM5_9HYPH|nr:DUF2336 domain-containing protein [Hansschlegelia zhihuaiae]RXF72899.1 DUF2336 domain-containing protein [Hansschlegelia zhihuaiae]